MKIDMARAMKRTNTGPQGARDREEGQKHLGEKRLKARCLGII